MAQGKGLRIPRGTQTTATGKVTFQLGGVSITGPSLGEVYDAARTLSETAGGGQATHRGEATPITTGARGPMSEAHKAKIRAAAKARASKNKPKTMAAGA